MTDAGRFSYDHSQWGSAGIVKRTGPDGHDTIVTYDDAGRVVSVVRGPVGSPILSVSYAYHPSGLIDTITYGNGTSIHYTYDAALRLTHIDHRDNVSATILDLEYAYTPHGLVSAIIESDALGVTARQTFTYDTHGRLIKEVRDDLATPANSYNFAYEYDPGGNRTKKIESLDGCNRIETVYTYDINDPGTYLSKANRLMMTQVFETCHHFEDFDPSASCAQNPADELIEESWYYYLDEEGEDHGNVTRVVTKEQNPDPGELPYSATRFIYAKNTRTVSYVAGETWDYPPEPPPTGGPSVCPTNYTLTYAREFQYDGPRQRYLNRELNPANISEIVSKTWSIYDGDTIYVDHVGAPSLYTRSYEPGMGTFSWTAGVPDTNSEQYYHTNMIGTTRMMTDSTGTDVAHAAYTAFGEQVGGSPRRYGYAGAHGYQTATGSTPGDAYETGFTFQHLGHRYYDPASGRFLQRDPIGIRGGHNVYEYVVSLPTATADPTGLSKTHNEGKRPSDLPSNWDKLTPKEKQKVIEEKLKNPKSKGHEKTWRGWKKIWRRKMVEEASRPPWWARWGQRIPAPDPQNVRKWQKRILIGGGGALICAGVAGTGGAAAPFLLPAL